MTIPPINRSLDASIDEEQQRIDIIIEQLEDGTVSLEHAQALHTEGTELIEALEEDLALGNGEIIDRP